MVDSISVLGGALGVTSLIIQLTDECVKDIYSSICDEFSSHLDVFKIYNAAADMPVEHRYLLVRLEIEQQRFLNFRLEAGLLHVDLVLYTTLQVNQSLLLAVLAAIKVLLDDYAKLHGQYSESTDDINNEEKSKS